MAMTLTNHYSLSQWAFNDYPFAESTDQLPDGTPNPWGRGLNDNWRDIDSLLWNIHEGLDMNIQDSKPGSIAGLYGVWGFNDVGNSKKTLMLEGYDSIWLVPNNDYIATQAYVNSVAQNMKRKDNCTVATTGNITLSGEQTIDGVLTSADRVLVWQQTDLKENGLYLSSSGAWTRTTDADIGTEILGALVKILQGTLYSNKEFNNSNTGAITIGVTDITFVDLGSTINHNDTANIFGDAAGYHLNQADYNALSDVNAQLPDLHDDGSPTFATLDVTGKLTVGGLIDPTGMGFTPQATTPLGALHGIWVDNTADFNLRLSDNFMLSDGQDLYFGNDKDWTITHTSSRWQLAEPNVWTYMFLEYSKFRVEIDDGYSWFELTDNILDLTVAGVEMIDATYNTLIFNNALHNVDIIFKGDTDANLLFIKGATDRIGVGTNSPLELFHVDGNFMISDSGIMKFGNDTDFYASFTDSIFNLIGAVSSDYMVLDKSTPSWEWYLDSESTSMLLSPTLFYIDLDLVNSFYMSDIVTQLNAYGGNVDTQIKGLSEDNLLFIDAGLDRIGVGVKPLTSDWCLLAVESGMMLKEVASCGNPVTGYGKYWVSTDKHAYFTTSSGEEHRLEGIDPISVVRNVYDFIGNGDRDNFTESASQGGGVETNNVNDPDFQGMQRIGINAAGVATDYIRISRESVGAGDIPLGKGEYTLKMRMKTHTLPTLGTNGYTTYLGLSEIPNDPSTITDGIYFWFNQANPTWQMTVKDTSRGVGGGTTTVDSGVTALADTIYHLEIIVNADATSVTGYVNGTATSAVTTNIPKWDGTDDLWVGLFAGMYANTNFGNARYTFLDFYDEEVPLTTRRWN